MRLQGIVGGDQWAYRLIPRTHPLLYLPICTYKTTPTGGIVAGFLADRIGKRDILAATIIMYSLGSLIAGAYCLSGFPSQCAYTHRTMD